jgi:cytochrome c oxidase cbb3-type subunit 1
MSASTSPQPGSETAASTGALSDGEIVKSSRLPLFLLFASAAVWLLLGSLFGLLASLKFHKPDMFADCACLSYGRIHAASTSSFLYGFGVQAGLAIIIWLFTWLGRTRLANGLLLTAGVAFWNFGVTVGVLGILVGEGTGFDNFEMPRYAALILFLSYLLMGIIGAVTLHQRRERPLITTHWFLLAALFWFPWIYSTAGLLLLTFPVRGVAQAVIDWWYSNNLQVVWFGLVGLGTALYALPRFLNRELYNSCLALLTFWTFILFASWGGIPNSAPVPAWMPAISTAATLLLVIPTISLAMIYFKTAGSLFPTAIEAEAAVPLRFISFGVLSFIVAMVLNILSSPLQVARITDFTWFVAARTFLNNYAFFAMIMFGAIYRIVPRLVGGELWKPGLVRAHFGLAIAGILFTAVPFLLGGLIQGFQLNEVKVPFLDTVKTTLMVVRVSTLGDLLLLAGHAVFVLNVVGVANRYYEARAASAYAAATADLFQAGAKS